MSQKSKTKSQQVLEANFHVCRSYSQKTGRGTFAPPSWIGLRFFCRNSTEKSAMNLLVKFVSASMLQWMCFALISLFYWHIFHALDLRLSSKYHMKPITIISAPTLCWSKRLQNFAAKSLLFWSITVWSRFNSLCTWNQWHCTNF